MTNNENQTKAESTIKETKAEQEVQNQDSTQLDTFQNETVTEEPAQPQVSQEDLNKAAEILLDQFMTEINLALTKEEQERITQEDRQKAIDLLLSGQYTAKEIVLQLFDAYAGIKPTEEPLPSVIKTEPVTKESKPEKVTGKIVESTKEVAGFKVISDKQDSALLWKIMAGLFGFTTLGVVAGLSILKFSAGGTWSILALVFCALFLVLVGFVMYLGKKTHAILEFKAMFSGKPLCMFFLDTKRVDWAVMEDEGGVVHHKKYGTFLVNAKSAYIDSKTRNVFLAFNPNIAVNADMETFKLTDSLSKVIKDERELGRIRHAIANATYDDATEELVIRGDKGMTEKLKPFSALRENIDFSHLKSFSNSLMPHNIGNKVQLEVERNILNKGRINIMQIILVFCAILGAIVLGVLIIKYVLGSPGAASSTVVNNFINGTAQAATNKVVPVATVVAQ